MTSTLFIGDLSSLCGIDDIEKLFSTCGTIVDIRLKHDELTKRQLSYGFVEFLNPKEAERAFQNLNRHILLGRALRISWAFSKPSLTKERSISSVSSDGTQPKSKTATKSSIHVVFYTAATNGTAVTEETLRNLFLPFGNFTDVIVKKTNKQNVINSKGYAFVHFADTDAGVASAMVAVREMGRGLVLDGVYYECSLSRSFQDTMAETAVANRTAPQQYSSHVYDSPGTSPSGVDGVMFFPPSVRVGDFCGDGAAGSPPAQYTHQQCRPVYPVEWHHHGSVYPTVPVTYMVDQPMFCTAPAASYPQQQHSPVYVDRPPLYTPMHYHHSMVQMTQGPAYYPVAAPMPMPFPSQPHGCGPVYYESYPQVSYPNGGTQQSLYGDRHYHQ